jgi:predicted ATPase
MLSQFNVSTTNIQLGDLNEEEINSLVSDALGILPRLSKSLGRVVFRKTKGNPYFALEFLRSLVYRRLVEYSLRDNRWIWDCARVGAEEISDNVLQLLSNKLDSISQNMQNALKIASCFGTQISRDVMAKLSACSDYSYLQSSLDDAVEALFLDCDEAQYRFVHDKVREAAYDRIDCKDQYHFELGMALMHSCSDALFLTIEQINHGVPALLTGTAHQIDVARLNYEASVKSMSSSDFTSAYDYIRAAVSLLSDDSWDTEYSFSLNCYIQFGKAAFPCGQLAAAKGKKNVYLCLC